MPRQRERGVPTATSTPSTWISVRSFVTSTAGAEGRSIPVQLFGMVGGAFGQPHLAGFLATFNADGNAYAVFDTLIQMPAALVGLNLDFAYVTLAPIDAASEPVRATVTLQ